MAPRKVKLETVLAGDTILPPARELSLWMRRRAAELGLTESALYLTVLGVREGVPDKRGRWLIVTTEQTPEWNASRPFTFRARPDTPWPLIAPAHSDVAAQTEGGA